MDKLRVLILWLPLLLSPCSCKKDLYLMGMLPMTGETWPGGGACLPPMEIALRQINERDEILPDYKLNLIWKDTACDAGKAMNAMYEMLYTKPTKHIIVGPACSTEAEVGALASSAWNITHLSYGVASPLMSDRKKYPRFFRLVNPDTRYNLLRIALLQEFGWSRIATINVALDFFSAISDHLVRSLRGTDIKVISQEIFENYPLTRLQSLKEKDTRIILSASYDIQARQLMCAAYKIGLYGPKVVWMFPGWYMEKWWVDPNNEITCTEEQMAKVAEGSLLTGFFFWNLNENVRGVANITTKEFSEAFNAHPNYNPNLSRHEFLSPSCFDSVWGSALALNCTETALRNSGSNKTLDEFDYSDREMADIITECVSNLSYVGMSGNIKFGDFGDPQKNIRLDQIQDGRKVLVGIYRTDVPEPYIEWRNGGVRWKDGIVPQDATHVNKVEVVIPRNLFFIMACVASFGIILAICFFIFNIIHRNNSYVKLSSPNINNVLLLGCILTYSGVYMESLKEKEPVLCKLKNFTLTIGFSMAFGALFSKTWRVYKIFSNKNLAQIRIKDSQLIGIVLGLVAVQAFILILWEIIDPIFILVRELKSEVFVTASEVQVFFIRVCTSQYQNYFSLTIYISEGILLAFGAFLAFETRKVKIPALNDSRLIGACLYNVIVLSAVGVTLNLSLQEQVGLVYGIMSAILIIGATSTQLVVFIPKVMAVYYPHRIDTAMTVHVSSSNRSTGSKVMLPRAPCNESETNSSKV